MRIYEIVFIASPTLSKEEVDSYTDQVVKTIEGKNGKIIKIDKLGKRNMAYRISRFKEAYYVLLTIEGSGPAIAEVERRFKVSDFIIRFLTVRVDQDWKRVEKMKVKRGTRDKAPVPPRPAEPSGPAVSAEA